MQIGQAVDLPVVLVLDAGKSARSIAAVVKGFECFGPELRFAGIVLNNVASDAHYRMLEQAIRSVTATPLLGRIAPDAAIAIPERHLGLHTAEETTSADRSTSCICAGRSTASGSDATVEAGMDRPCWHSRSCTSAKCVPDSAYASVSREIRRFRSTTKITSTCCESWAQRLFPSVR